MKVLLAVLLALAAGCSREPGCKMTELAKLEQALNDPSIPAKMHEQLAFEGIAEACAPKLPKGITSALKQTSFGDRDPSERARAIATALTTESAFMEDACPDFKKVFGHLAGASDARSRTQLLFAECRYDRLALMSADEFSALPEDSVGPIFAAPLYVWLKDHGVPAAQARKILRDAENLH